MAQRSFMHVELRAPAAGEGPEVRRYAATDGPALADLMHRAYQGTVDDEGGTPEEAAAEIARTVAGDYGTFMPECSQVLEREGRLLSATLVTRFQGRPFVAFTFTDPACTGQGLARRCMQAAMVALYERGERELRLVVTLANAPAVRLYTRLGFRLEGG